jgi:outer membrane biogenesis lipoprotein LolB
MNLLLRYIRWPKSKEDVRIDQRGQKGERTFTIQRSWHVRVEDWHELGCLTRFESASGIRLATNRYTLPEYSGDTHRQRPAGI